jgi:HEAT repeats
MFARAAALLALACSLAHVSAQDADPVYEGQKVSKWIDTVQNDSSARKRALAVEALGHIWTVHKHKEALPNVGRALRVDPSAAVRAQAAVVISGLRPDDIKYSATDLVTALDKEKESRVRKEIVSAMLKFPDVCALGIEPLAAALKDTDAAVKVAAAEALALAGPVSKGAAKAAAPALEPRSESPQFTRWDAFNLKEHRRLRKRWPRCSRRRRTRTSSANWSRRWGCSARRPGRR